MTSKEAHSELNDKDGYYPKRNGIDFYHFYKQDLKYFKEIGSKTIRISIKWSRIFPTMNDVPNEKGLSYYDNLIDEIIRNRMEPIITILHYEIPLYITEGLGGWENKKSLNDMNFLLKPYLIDTITK